MFLYWKQNPATSETSKKETGPQDGAGSPSRPLTWRLVQLLQHGEQTVVKKEL